MKKGIMIYTSFAIISSSLLLGMVFLPVVTVPNLGEGDASRIGEASFFMESVVDDSERSMERITERALSSSTNYVLTNGTKLSRPRENLTSVVVDGELSGFQLSGMEGATLIEWRKRVSDIADRSGYRIEIELRNSSFNASGMDVDASYTLFSRLEDPVTLASFNRTRTIERSVSVEGLEDPMLSLRTAGDYVSTYSRCEFDSPAELLGDGKYHSGGTFHGDAKVNPSSLTAVSEEDEKVLAVDDVDSYPKTKVENFGGVISAQPNSSAGYDTVFLFDISGRNSIEDVEQNMSVTVAGDQVWRSNFREMFLQGCYIPDSTGPDVFDRYSNKLVSADDGLATFLDVPDLPAGLQQQGSAVAHVYFNESGDYGGLKEIEGVSSEYSWFRIDQEHVESWGIEDLAG